MAVTTGLGVELQGVSKRFGATAALDGIDLVIPPGQFLTLIGPSGCGKTTLLRLVAGLAEPDGGTVTVGDQAPRAAQTARQLGFVPQSPGLLPWRNCSDLRVDVSVADLLATVANQEVMRVGGPDWADPISSSLS